MRLHADLAGRGSPLDEHFEAGLHNQGQLHRGIAAAAVGLEQAGKAYVHTSFRPKCGYDRLSHNGLVGGRCAPRTGLHGLGLLDPFGGAVIAGFTCQQVDGVHIRGEEYEIEIVDEDGQMLPMGEKGRVILVPKAAPMHRLAVGDYACISAEPCPCGCTAPKLVNIDTIKDEVLELSKLGESLHYWSSVLDCRIEKTDCGLLLELVVFQGEKLPKLPTAAKLVIRPFNPETDEPFDHLEVVKNRFLSENSH